MITVEEAKNLISKHSKKGKIEDREIGSINGYVLAEDIYSPLNLPSFNQSAMDGYALRITDTLIAGTKLKLVGEVKAGDEGNVQVNSGEIIRIFTGALVPDSCNAIIIQENISKDGDFIITNKEVNLFDNIRKTGVQIKDGDLALEKGSLITPAAVSFIAMLGFAEVKVYSKPKVGIVVTGNELVTPGEPLLPGQIYESNSFALATVVEEHGGNVIEISRVKDDYQSTFDQLKNTLSKIDILIVSGGISVGDYDFVGKALLEIGVKEIFYKVRQKPGKPLFFATQSDKLVFALPGNPASALVCFYQYVLPAMNNISGKGTEGLNKMNLRSKSSYTRKGDRAIFLKALVSDNGVQILEGQLSHMMHTFAVSNALVYIPITVNDVAVGDLVECYSFSK